MHCLKAEGRYMKAGASIVNAASTAGISGTPNMAAYGASKHAVVGYVRKGTKTTPSPFARCALIESLR